jgi:hypothetical protein
MSGHGASNEFFALTRVCLPFGRKFSVSPQYRLDPARNAVGLLSVSPCLAPVCLYEPCALASQSNDCRGVGTGDL